MKFFNEPVDTDIHDYVVLPRPKKNLVFKVVPTTSFEDFDTLCQLPTPGFIQRPGKAAEPDYDAPSYKTKKMDYLSKRMSFIILKSLEQTEGLTWDTIDMEKPETWENYMTEFKDAGLNDAEIRLVVQACLQINGLDDTKIKEAREAFLAGLTAQQS